MTTAPVMTVTDELLADLEAAAGRATQGRWCTDSQAWVCAADSDQLNAGFVISICEGSDDIKNADYISKAGPQTITALTAELRRLRAENAELAKDAGRLEWMVTEGAVIASMNGTGRPMCYQVSFPFESRQQLDWFPSWRGAVDDIMAAQ